MRRKTSDRSKQKGTPDKSPEKSSRRSHRHSRRRRKSSSSSSSDDEKSIKKGTKDIKTESKISEEKGFSSAKITETGKTDIGNEVTAESSKKNIKKTTETTNSPSETKNKEDLTDEWKEDKEFWNSSEGLKESETADSTAKEKDGGSMWKVQSANGAGGEIQKLKICRQRPAENSDSGDSSKRRSSRPSDGGASSRSTDESVTEECEKETRKSKHRTRTSSRNSPLLESSKVVCDVSEGSPTKIKIINVGNLVVDKKAVEKSENIAPCSQELYNNVLNSDIPLPSDNETKVSSAEEKKQEDNEISPSLDEIQTPLEKCNSTDDTTKPSEEIKSELSEVNEKSIMAVDLSEIPEPPDEPKSHKKPEAELEDNHEDSKNKSSQLDTSERKDPDSDSRSRSSRSSSSSNESEGTNEEESQHRKTKVKIRRQHRNQSPSAEQHTDKKKASSDSEEDRKKEEDREETSQSIESNSCKENKPVRSPETTEGGNEGASEKYKVRKRRWGASKTIRPVKKPLVSISTNSLKDLVPGAKPVSNEELQLSVEEEEGQLIDDDDDDIAIQEEDEVTILTMSETKVEEKPKEKEREIEEKKKESRKEREKSEDDRKRKNEKKQKTKLEQPSVNDKGGNQRKILLLTDDARKLARSPSPPRRRPSCVLYITNLVRPFTVQQLKNLLLRTGTIAENGFWIDNIKSKCYVEYTTEDAAVETRHALHGVRWPVSNPKTLIVEFSTHDDMAVAQALAEETEPIPRKAEPLILDRSVEGWLNEQARLKGERPARRVMASVREWDVGKPEHPDEIIEHDLHIKERQREQERRIRKERLQRSPSDDNSEPPVRKLRRKEDDAPAKLLDDLFRKTKSSPCIYWLPLTQEQIVVKEEIRRQHMAEHERRVAELKKADQARRDRDRRNRK